MPGSRPLSHAETLKLLGHLRGPRDRCLFVLGLQTGLRIGELVQLTVSHVRSRNSSSVSDWLYVDRRLRKGKTQGHGLPLGPIAQDAISAWLKHHPAPVQNAPLFPSRKAGRPLSRDAAARIIKSAALDAGLSGRITSHSLRKTFASRVHAAVGGDLQKTQHALGHKSITSTIHYLQCETAAVETAIRELLHRQDQLTLWDE